MDLKEFYFQREERFQKESKAFRRKVTLFSVVRLVHFLLIPLLFVLLMDVSVWLSIFVALVLGVLFGFSIRQHISYQLEEKVCDYISQLNRNEIKSVEGNLKGFDGGLEFKPKDHKYASDLDVFGESSLFALINRTSTWPGRRKLADWLLDLALVDVVINRQEAVKELTDRVDFRQKLQSFRIRTADLGNNPASVLEWIQSENLIANPTKVLLLILVFSVISFAGIALAAMGKGYGLLTISVVCNLLIGLRYGGLIKVVHEKLSRASSYLDLYSLIIGHIKTQTFESKLLIEYYHCFFNGDHSASHSIKRFSKILERFDLRLNVMLSIPLNLFFFWDIWQLISLERWKVKHGKDISLWFETLGEFEAISSLANLAFNNKEWIFPKINQTAFLYNAKDLGHPLISKGKRVCNDLSFVGSGAMLLVTGSNMSGKSTFLRTLGINMVLAGAGSPVCASSCELALRTPFTSMRVADSLEENISTFYAELKRISDIIKSVNNGEQVILLLDEVLRGTNSNDRHKGALALLRQLVASESVGVMATHDLELADPSLITDGRLLPFFFDVQVDGDELYFDYKLHKGKCTTLNASILMRKMGIDIDFYTL